MNKKEILEKYDINELVNSVSEYLMDAEGCDFEVGDIIYNFFNIDPPKKIQHSRYDCPNTIEIIRDNLRRSMTGMYIDIKTNDIINISFIKDKIIIQGDNDSYVRDFYNYLDSSNIFDISQKVFLKCNWCKLKNE